MKIGIYGYGNLGRGTELAVRSTSDMELYGIFTRRPPADMRSPFPETQFFPANDVTHHKDNIDVMIICGGSASDLPEMTPRLAADFNVVDSFDTHAKIGAHFDNVDNSARTAGHTAIISAGWDPGLFSLLRLMYEVSLPNGESYTFWGRGVSQGHSEAVRRIDGVVDARQYTVPIESAVDRVRSGERPQLTTRERHRRVCYVTVEDSADLERIRREIVTMPDYFADYDTDVIFIGHDEMEREHGELPHGGVVIRSGVTGIHSHTLEFSITLGSNPEFTGSVLVAYARAAYRRAALGHHGCFTVFDIAPAELSPYTASELRERLL